MSVFIDEFDTLAGNDENFVNSKSKSSSEDDIFPLDEINDDSSTESSPERKLDEEWQTRLSTKRTFSTGDIFDVGTNIWVIIGTFSAGETLDGDDKIRSHGTMGWTWMTAAPIQYEYKILRSYYESIYILDEPVCLAPALTKPFFIWFQDTDIKQTKPLTANYVRKICTIVVRVISSFYAGLKYITYSKLPAEWDEEDGWWTGAGEGIGRLRFIVASSGFKEGVNSQKQCEYGLGLHFYSIGRLMVTVEQALLMRLVIINECLKELGIRKPEDGYNTWEDVFDSGVYKGLGGTRMLGSCKVKPCELCNKKKDVQTLLEEMKALQLFEKQYAVIKDGKRTVNTPKSKPGTCPKCLGRKRYLENKAYEAKFVLNHLGDEDEELNWLLDDPFQAILATSIRIRVQGGVETYWRCIPGYSLEYLQNQEKAKKMKATVESGKAAKNGQIYGPDSDETQLVLMFVKKLSPEYEDLIPENLKRIKNEEYVLNVKMYCRNYNYCLKCKTSHQNRSKFVVTKEYVLQKSYSENLDCKMKSSPRVKIDENLRKVLFGDQSHFSSLSTNGPGEQPQNRTDENFDEIQTLLSWGKKKEQEHDAKGTREKALNKLKKRFRDENISVPIVPQSFEERLQNEIFSGKKKKPSKDSNSNLFEKQSGVTWGSFVD
jgi:hypothetical protein